MPSNDNADEQIAFYAAFPLLAEGEVRCPFCGQPRPANDGCATCHPDLFVPPMALPPKGYRAKSWRRFAAGLYTRYAAWLPKLPPDEEIVVPPAAPFTADDLDIHLAELYWNGYKHLLGMSHPEKDQGYDY